MARPGERLQIPAAVWNDLLAMRGQWQRERGSLLVPSRNLAVTKQDLVRVQNDSGQDVARFEILGIDDILITPEDNLAEFQSGFALKGITPAIASHFGQFVVAQEPIADQKIGWCAIGGLTAVKVQVDTASYTFADITDASRAKLTSRLHGSARILYKEAGTGEKWALVRMHDPAGFLWRFTLNEDMGETTSDQAAADLLTMDGTDTTRDVDVRDPLSMFAGLVNDDAGYCLEQGGQFYVIQAPC